MSSETKKIEYNVYQSILITVGAVVLSMGTKRVLKMPLGTTESCNGTLKLTIAVSVSSSLVGWLQDKNHIPKNPFK